MQARWPVRIPSANFLPAITQDHGISVTVALPRALQVPGASGRAILDSLLLRSSVNQAWDVWFWATPTHSDGTADTDSWLGNWMFQSTDAATPLSGDPSPTPYKYFTFGLGLEVYDALALGNLYLTLISRGADKALNALVTLELGFSAQVTGL